MKSDDFIVSLAINAGIGLVQASLDLTITGDDIQSILVSLIAEAIGYLAEQQYHKRRRQPPSCKEGEFSKTDILYDDNAHIPNV